MSNDKLSCCCIYSAFLAMAMMGCGEPPISSASTAAESSSLRDRSRYVQGSLVAIAVLDGSNPEGVTPLVAYLDGTRSFSGDPTRWIAEFRWDFGDGTPVSNHGWVAHTYSQPGSYRATLTVTDNTGQSASTSLTLLAHPAKLGPKPVLDLYSRRIGAAPLTVSVDGTRSQGRDRNTWVTGYEWNFGDGSPAVRSGWTRHTYQAPGVYQATLAVTDSGGLTRTESVQVTVCASGDQICLDQLGRLRWKRELCPTGGCETVGLDSDLAGDLFAALNFTGPSVDIGSGVQGDGQDSAKGIVAKYGPDGGLLWSYLLAAEPLPNHTILWGVHLQEIRAGPNGEVWLRADVSSAQLTLGTGQTLTGPILIKLTAEGEVDVAAQLNIAELRVDTEGNVFTLDWTNTIQSWDAKDGRWVSRWELFNETLFQDLGVDGAGNIFAAGQGFLSGKAGITKFAADGSILWSKVVGTGNGAFFAPVAGPNGELLLRGRFFQGSFDWAGTTYPADSRDYLLLGDGKGGERWAKPLPVGPVTKFGHRGSLLTTEPFPNSQRPPRLFSYSLSGFQLWSRPLPMPAGYYAWDLELQPAGVGVLGGTLNGGPAFLLSLED